VILLQDEIMSIVKDSTFDNEMIKNQIEKIVIPKWTEAEKIAEEMNTLEVSISNKNKAKYLLEFILLRKQEADLRIKVLNGDEEASLKLNETILKSNEIVEKIK
jgi:hypothetical protein